MEGCKIFVMSFACLIGLDNRSTIIFHAPWVNFMYVIFMMLKNHRKYLLFNHRITSFLYSGIPLLRLQRALVGRNETKIFLLK